MESEYGDETDLCGVFVKFVLLILGFKIIIRVRLS